MRNRLNSLISVLIAIDLMIINLIETHVQKRWNSKGLFDFPNRL